MENETMKYYEESAALLKLSLIELQGKLDDFSKASELLTSGTSLPVRMMNRVSLGEVTRNFSELAKSIFEHQDKVKSALTSKAAPEVASEGNSSES